MQDNEFDDLFRSKLGGLEVQPSAHVWDNIAAGLGTPKKKSILPMLSMAATTLILLAAGTWFLLDKPVKQVQNQVVRTKTTVSNKPVAEPATAQVEGPEMVEATSQLITAGKSATNHIAKVKVQPAVVHKVSEPLNAAPVVTPTSTDVQPQQVLAAVPVQAVAHPVLPEIQLASSTLNNDIPVLKSINATAPVTVTASQIEKKKKHGIHSLGDLINVVVSKVDKREDKLIEFTESDDDESNVTGINLGIIKIKKEK
ncbi:hypothetical protein MUGA111182_19660 [Mucilaginibacter galii]|uniref:Uncharacterized protein n=2 Tax=Mucilaginibacter galii TaxID=2005073 RepID=A0A917J767_9SPHI|nr:hypothetical protein GCM10011425_05440 [Mucilaginibacter galii]